jgi:hypothetical protein
MKNKNRKVAKVRIRSKKPVRTPPQPVAEQREVEQTSPSVPVSPPVAEVEHLEAPVQDFTAAPPPPPTSVNEVDPPADTANVDPPKRVSWWNRYL